MPTDPNRDALARSLGGFWYWGAGPSHSDIDRVFAALDLTDRVGDGGKREKVERAVQEALPAEIPWLVRALVELLWEGGFLEPSDENQRELTMVQRRLEPFGVSFDGDGVHLRSIRVGSDGGLLLSSESLRGHIERIHRALDDDDSEQVLGSAKELLESTAKLVLHERSVEAPSKFPALMHAALDTLGLHPKAVSGDDGVADATRRILGALNQVALGVNELRRDFGTGHGRLGGPKLSLRHARLSAGAATTLATLMMSDAFQRAGSSVRPARRSASEARPVASSPQQQHSSHGIREILELPQIRRTHWQEPYPTTTVLLRGIADLQARRSPGQQSLQQTQDIVLASP